jgi:aspartate racemase
MACIGVIGGVGPFAGLDLVRNVFINTRAVKDQDHLNCVLVSCPSIIPDRTSFLLQEGEKIENPAYGMFECAKHLRSAGADYAVVACNTAHAGRIFSIFSKLVKENLKGLQIVNMLETCAVYVKDSLKINKLGLLATKGTHKSRVYHEYFKKKADFDLLEPGLSEQEKVHEAIYSESFGIKSNSQPVTSRATEIIYHEIFRLIDKGAKAVILGCTELPLAVKPQDFSIPIIDPGFIAARKLISLIAPGKLSDNIN